MIYKKELHKVHGDENSIDEIAARKLTAKWKVEECYREHHKETWQKKREPKSSWYPETPNIHVYGDKK